jgi:rRNA maturation endonuclease Nob1
MTKVCPNCKIENPDKAEFCQDCGSDLNESTNTVNADKTSGNGIGFLE